MLIQMLAYTYTHTHILRYLHIFSSGDVKFCEVRIEPENHLRWLLLAKQFDSVFFRSIYIITYTDALSKHLVSSYDLFSVLFLFVIVAYVIVTAPWAIFFVLHFTTTSRTRKHTHSGRQCHVYNFYIFLHDFIHLSATHMHKISMHLTAAFYNPAFVAIIWHYWHLPFWMFIDLRGSTLKTLHACTGVSTGKNGQRRSARDATVDVDWYR